MNISPWPWRFGTTELNDETLEDEFIDKPLDYSGPGYYNNPKIVDANGEQVVGNDEYNVFYSGNQAANVALLLAAPDLLEALETVLANYIKVLDTGSPLFVNIENYGDITKARAAINKAKGEAT